MFGKFYVIICLLFSCFCFVGCNSIEMNNRQRIVGIIDACKAQPKLMNPYLKKKVDKQQIDQLVAFVIQECLK